MKKLKIKEFVSITQEDAEKAMQIFTEDHTKLKLIEAQLETEKQQISASFLPNILQLKQSIEKQGGILETYAQQRKQDWKGKSIELIHGRIGFRMGNPKLTKDKNKTWEFITEIIRKKFPQYIRMNYQINKEAIISIRLDKDFLKVQKACHLNIIQEEAFFIEPISENHNP